MGTAKGNLFAAEQRPVSFLDHQYLQNRKHANGTGPVSDGALHDQALNLCYGAALSDAGQSRGVSVWADHFQGWRELATVKSKQHFRGRLFPYRQP